jgi:hypothetical protein
MKRGFARELSQQQATPTHVHEKGKGCGLYFLAKWHNYGKYIQKLEEAQTIFMAIETKK